MKVAVLKHTRKTVIWPWAVLITLLLVIASPIGLVYGLFYDDSTKTIALQEGMTADSLGNRITVDSLDKTKETHYMEAVVTENDVDNLIHYGLEQSGFESKIFSKAYVNVDGNRYKFYADIDLEFFKTRIRFDTLLGESADHKDFVFSVQEITIGRMGGFKKLAESPSAAFVTENSVNNFLEKTGLSIHYEEKNTRFVYSKIDAFKDMHHLKQSQSENIDLYLSIINNMIDDNLVQYDFHGPDFINAKLNLEILANNSIVDDSHMLVNPDEVTTVCKSKLLILINNHKFDENEVDPTVVFQYLFSGWNGLSPENKVLIEGIDMSLIGIENKYAYQGFGLVDPSFSLQTQLNNSINVDNLISKNSTRNKKVSTLKESEINHYLAGRNVVGYTTMLSRWNGNYYKANYITIDNFYCNLYNATIEGQEKAVAEFVAKINVNGYHTSFTMVSYAGEDAQQGKSLVYTIADTKYGNADGTSMKKDILNILAKALNDGDQAMVAIENDDTIRFNFDQNLDYTQHACEDKVLENTGHQYDFVSYFVDNNINIHTTGSSRSDDGTIYVTLTQGINY